jgi:hypothetical protein
MLMKTVVQETWNARRETRNVKRDEGAARRAASRSLVGAEFQPNSLPVTFHGSRFTFHAIKSREANRNGLPLSSLKSSVQVV